MLNYRVNYVSTQKRTGWYTTFFFYYKIFDAVSQIIVGSTKLEGGGASWLYKVVQPESRTSSEAYCIKTFQNLQNSFPKQRKIDKTTTRYAVVTMPIGREEHQCLRENGTRGNHPS